MSKEQLIYIAEYILTDMQEPLSYLPKGMIWGLFAALFSILLELWSAYRGRKFQWKRVIAYFLLGTYLYVFLEQSFFSRQPGSRSSVNMEFFGVWNNSLRDKAYTVENLMMFIPFGALVPACIRKTRTLWSVVPLSFMASVCLEYMQFSTRRGHCQLDDVLMNTIGGLIGYLVFRLFCKILKKV